MSFSTCRITHEKDREGSGLGNWNVRWLRGSRETLGSPKWCCRAFWIVGFRPLEVSIRAVWLWLYFRLDSERFNGSSDL